MTETLPPPVSAPRGGRRLALVAAAVALVLGAWLALDALGAPTPSFARYWPVFLLLGGLVSLADFVLSARSPSAIAGAFIGLGLGSFLLVFTTRQAGWSAFFDWLPMVLVIFGVAAIAAWLASGSEHHQLLVLGIVLLGFGLTGLALTVEAIRRILPKGELLWAILLLVAGGLLAVRLFRRR
jgi:hypothetical protein